MQEGVIGEVKENKNFLICLVRSGTFIVVLKMRRVTKTQWFAFSF